MKCKSCNTVTIQNTTFQPKFISSQKAIADLNENIKKSEKTITSLRERVAEETRKNEELEEYKRKVEFPAGSVNCSECGNIDNETNIQVCNTCTLKRCEGLEQCTKHIISNGIEVKSIAICAVCAIRNHMKKGHTVNDFFPIMRNIEYNAHYENLAPKREGLKGKNCELRSSIDKMWGTIDDGEKELDKMTEMLKRSKTSDLQKKLVDRIGDEILKHQEFIEKLNEAVNEVSGDMKNVVGDLGVKNDVEDLTNCEKEEMNAENACGTD